MLLRLLLLLFRFNWFTCCPSSCSPFGSVWGLALIWVVRLLRGLMLELLGRHGLHADWRIVRRPVLLHLTEVRVVKCSLLSLLHHAHCLTNLLTGFVDGRSYWWDSTECFWHESGGLGSSAHWLWAHRRWYTAVTEALSASERHTAAFLVAWTIRIVGFSATLTKAGSVVSTSTTIATCTVSTANVRLCTTLPVGWSKSCSWECLAWVWDSSLVCCWSCSWVELLSVFIGFCALLMESRLTAKQIADQVDFIANAISFLNSAFIVVKVAEGGDFVLISL